jgi:hypothetical protein
MEYWTILWVTVLGGQLDGTVYGIPYTSEVACAEATRTVSDTLDYDHNLTCEVTPTLSASIRPKRRPEGLVNE